MNERYVREFRDVPEFRDVHFTSSAEPDMATLLFPVDLIYCKQFPHKLQAPPPYFILQ